jgi:hypothetical protein
MKNCSLNFELLIFFLKQDEDEPLIEDISPVQNQATVMAAMAVAGGIDNRPHLGGTVKHLTNGIGVVTKITPKGKIHVQFGSRNLRVCRLNELTSVSSNSYLYYMVSDNVFSNWLMSLVTLFDDTLYSPCTT